jgi:predicted alpha/beta superfamily hydrolase
LVETLKPYIDKNYRTKSSRENTFIAGSSMGGLISYYAMLKYPETFGKAGVFSPAFWTAPAINELTDSLSNKMKGQFFFFAGELEGGEMVSDMKNISDKLGENSGALIYTVVDPEGRHNEPTWRKWFEEFYLWITGNGLSYQVKP